MIFRAEDFAQWARDSGFTVEIRAQSVSTNSELLAAARAGGIAQKCILLAQQQSGGRGRMGRSWTSAAQAYTFTLGRILPAATPAAAAMPLAAATACCRVLRAAGVPVLLKWPNDLVIGTEKTGGILVESLPEKRGVFFAVGVGINLTVPQNVAAAAGVADYLPADCDKVQLLKNLWENIDTAVSLLSAQGFSALREEYLAFSRDLGREVCLLRDSKKVAQGRFHGIGAHGGLILCAANGVCKEFVSGDISLRLPEH